MINNFFNIKVGFLMKNKNFINIVLSYLNIVKIITKIEIK